MNGDLRYASFIEVKMMAEIMFKRKIYGEMLEWKEKRSDKYALLIKGVRRVGMEKAIFRKIRCIAGRCKASWKVDHRRRVRAK